MMPSPIEQAVLAFVQLHSCGEGPVSRHTLVFDEMHLDGADAFTFMDDFFDDFDVDVTGYDHDRYAMSERDLFNPFRAVWRGLFHRPTLSFPVSHLMAVAEQGRWFDYHPAPSALPGT